MNRSRATAVLLVGHCAGMIDMVALPVWVGALIGWYKFDPQQAGLLATLFLAGQVASSLFLAPRFGRLPVRSIAVIGFAAGALAFAGVSMTHEYATMAALHLAGGLGAGCALSTTHGLFGRSANPHRLFAHASLALGIMGIVILGAGPAIVAGAGAPTMFLLFAGIMTVAAFAAASGYPRAVSPESAARAGGRRLSPLAWFAMIGMGCMSLQNAMIFSFVERIGIDRGYGTAAVGGALMAAGLVNLLPPALAALLERRLRAERVLLAGPFLHGLLTLLITQGGVFALYAGAVALLIGVVVFTHTFLFGVLARLDPSGRAVAATPAMLMIGSSIGPLLGGTIVKGAGYAALGYAVTVVATCALLCFARLQQGSKPVLAPDN